MFLYLITYFHCLNISKIPNDTANDLCIVGLATYESGRMSGDVNKLNTGLLSILVCLEEKKKD